MIGYLKGNLVFKRPPELLIDVNGIGYELYASMNTFYQLPEVGQEVILCTHLVIREDSHNLYGFYNERERSLFRELIKVSGIGPKIAIAILSSIDPDGFICCITNNYVASLCRIPGIGKKTAERLIVEMRDKLSRYEKSANLSDLKVGVDLSYEQQIIQDAISALIALGYKPAEASKEVSRIKENYDTSEELIRLVLKGISRFRVND